MRIKTCIVVLLTALLVMSASSAEELTVSGRVNAVMYADKALEEHYGITLLMQDYFLRTVEEKEDNVFIVRYEGIENYAYVLGRYGKRHDCYAGDSRKYKVLISERSKRFSNKE